MGARLRPVLGMTALALSALGLPPGTAWAAGTASTTATSATGSANASSPTCSPSLFTAAQQRVERALAGRVTQLQALEAAVQSPTSGLTPSDRDSLAHDITSVELPGIEALQPQVQQATTCLALRQDAHDMVFDYRVYVVMTPQTHETIVADRETDIAGKLTGLEPTVQSAIAWARQHGRNVTDAQSDFADMQARLSSASSALTGLSSTLLAQSPAGYPANAGVFLTGRTDETNARNDLRSAFGDLVAIARDVRGSNAGAPAATTTTS